MKQMRFRGAMRPSRPWLALGLGGLLVLLCLALVSHLPAPTMAANTVSWTKIDPPTTSGTYLSVALGDFNYDGHLDIVAGASGDGVSVWVGDGTGSWSTDYGPTTTGTYHDVALGDVDDDGLLDIVAVEFGTGVHVWTNDGTGTWSTMTSPATGVKFTSVAVGDINRDGKLDIAAGSGENAGIQLWTGDGAGTWTSASSGLPTTGNYTALAIGDIVPRGNADLAAASEDKGVRAWKGNGGGSWTENSSGLPTGGNYNGLGLGDLDNDVDLDIVATTGDGNGVRAWLVSGTSTWSWVESSSGLPTSGSFGGVALGDVDNDGKLDAAAAALSGGVRVWTGDGAGSWTDASDVLPTSGDFYDVALGDVTDDGMLDLAAGTSGSGVRAWKDTGTPDTLGGWVQIASPTTTGNYLDLDVGDLNLDGDLDVVAASTVDGLQSWTGDGGNSWQDFSTVTSPDLPSTGYFEAVALGQIEEDRWPDLVAATGDGNGLRAWMLRDTDAWIEVSTGLSTTKTYLDVALGDLDDDGYLDVVAGSSEVGLRAWTFDPVPVVKEWDPASSGLPTSGNYSGVALGDLNHDGNLDIVAASKGSGVGVWEGDGASSWKSMTSTTTSGNWTAVAVGDVDDDGHLDVVAASESLGVRIWGGDGSYGWTALTAPVSSGNYGSVCLGDFNNDGDLDVGAGSGSGLETWAGNGGTAWTAFSTNLPGTGSYPGVVFGEIDRDGALDLLAAKYGGGSVHAWTGAESAPPSGWTNFAPSTWISDSQEVDCSIQVQDTGSGLDVDSAMYRYQGVSGAWSGWAEAVCTGSDGTTDPQTLSVEKVPFGQDSGPGPNHEGNWIQFQVADTMGNVGYSSQELVYIDTTPPDNPDTFDSSHWPAGAWESDDTVDVDWSGATDDTSGVWRYSYVFNTFCDLPDTVVDLDAADRQVTSPALGDGEWYIGVRTLDEAGNWAADAACDGPYRIDTGPPTNPTTFEADPPPGSWVRDRTVEITWSGASDGGSDVWGYSHAWSQNPSGWANDTVDTNGTSATSPALDDGDSWTFHIRTVDLAGNWTDEAAHYGPFMIDRTAPTASINMTSHETNVNPFSVYWSGWDASSGVVSYDVQVSSNGVDWGDWLLATVDRSDSYHGQVGDTYYFRVRARDDAGNVGAWSSAFDITVGVDVTVRVNDEWGDPLSGAIVYLNGVEQGVTGGDGTLVVHHVVINDQLTAKYLIEEEAAVKAQHEWPYGSGWSYRTYITNVDFDDVGMVLTHYVSNTRETQVLVVRRDNPLIGFHLLISVEWDADRTYLDQVVAGFHGGVEPATNYLFDLTDGQMIYEAVEVVDNGAHWADADYQIHASNTVWPNSTNARIYQVTGRGIQVGRYFDGGSSNSGPWTAVIAQRMFNHEFGHYGFDLKDEYRDADGNLGGICTTDRATAPAGLEACFMEAPSATTEICSYHADHDHNPDTLQHEVHAEPCWNTIYRRYRSTRRDWILERPTDRGSLMRGPFGVAIEDWTYSTVTDVDTGVCAPFTSTWMYPAVVPVIDGDVWVEGARVIQQGQTLADGTLIILGAHNGDTLRLEVECGPNCSWSDSTTVSCADLSAQAVPWRIVKRDPFSLHLSAVPRDGGQVLDVRAQASVALGNSPTVELWQDGAAGPIPVTLAYDQATDSYTGSASLNAELGQSGVLWGQASDTQGRTVTVLAPFDVMPVASDEHAELSSDDGNLKLFLKPGSLVDDPVVSIMTDRAISPTQDSLVLVGKAYEVTVSTGQYALDQPAVVSIYYHAEAVTDVTTDTLQIYRWHAESQRWVSAGDGVHDPDHSAVSVQVDHLSTFALLGQRRGAQVYLPVVLKNEGH